MIPVTGLESPALRADWNQYFMGIAHQAATRATCPRKHVGAVIVRDRTVLSTGYNGSVRGLPHCEDVGCVMEDGHCVTTVHAEANAILQAAKNGVSIEGRGPSEECQIGSRPSPGRQTSRIATVHDS